MLVKNPIVTLQWLQVILQKRLWILENNWQFIYNKQKITYPIKAYNGVLWSIREIFIDEYYNDLCNLDNVLDLWWYFWESAIYLSQKNKHIDVYEADPDIYKYLKENTKSITNITGNNIAIVWLDNVNEIYFDDLDCGYTMSWSITKEKTWKIVKCKHIKDILHETKYDGIKIDIEWSEHDIVSWINRNYNWSNFNVWYIEFHYTNHEHLEKIDIFFEFLDLLLKSNFKFSIYNAHNGNQLHNIEILKADILDKKLDIFYIYFKKYKNA